MSLRETILAANDLKLHKLYVNDWDCDVWVRVMTGRERDAFEASIMRNGTAKFSMENVRARLVSLTACDESGARIFTDADVEALGGKSSAALDEVFTLAQSVNRFTKKDAEELAGN